MSRGLGITQAEFDYLKLLQKRKVGQTEAATQTGRGIGMVGRVYRATTLADYKAQTKREKKPKQASLPIHTVPARDRSPKEITDAIKNLSDLYWQLAKRVKALEDRPLLGQPADTQLAKRKFWR